MPELIIDWSLLDYLRARNVLKDWTPEEFKKTRTGEYAWESPHPLALTMIEMAISAEQLRIVTAAVTGGIKMPEGWQWWDLLTPKMQVGDHQAEADALGVGDYYAAATGAVRSIYRNSGRTPPEWVLAREEDDPEVEGPQALPPLIIGGVVIVGIVATAALAWYQESSLESWVRIETSRATSFYQAYTAIEVAKIKVAAGQDVGPIPEIIKRMATAERAQTNKAVMTLAVGAVVVPAIIGAVMFARDMSKKARARRANPRPRPALPAARASNPAQGWPVGTTPKPTYLRERMRDNRTRAEAEGDWKRHIAALKRKQNPTAKPAKKAPAKKANAPKKKAPAKKANAPKKKAPAKKAPAKRKANAPKKKEVKKKTSNPATKSDFIKRAMRAATKNQAEKAWAARKPNPKAKRVVTKEEFMKRKMGGRTKNQAENDWKLRQAGRKRARERKAK